MSTIFNKHGKKANTEATDLVNIDLNNGDYTSRNSNEHFGLLLPAAANIKLQTIGGSIDIFPLPAGWNPVACTKIFQNGSSLTTFVVFY